MQNFCIFFSAKFAKTNYRISTTDSEKGKKAKTKRFSCPFKKKTKIQKKSNIKRIHFNAFT